VPDLIKEINYTPAAVARACSVWLPADNALCLAAPAGSETTNSLFYVIDLENGSIVRRSQINAATLNVVNRLMTHGDYGGQVYTHGGSDTANGAAIVSHWKSKAVAHGGLGVYKRYKKLVISAEGSGSALFIIKWRVIKTEGELIGQQSNSNSSGSRWDEMLWSVDTWAGNGAALFDIKNLGRGKALALEIHNAESSGDVHVKQIWLEFEGFGNAKG
jgi:hypothetical protein